MENVRVVLKKIPDGKCKSCSQKKSPIENVRAVLKKIPMENVRAALKNISDGNRKYAFKNPH